jgi:hypothetical protein
MTKPALTLAALLAAAAHFAVEESDHRDPGLYGVTDGKALGTHLEHRFRHFLQDRFAFQTGNSAKGIDFPDLDVDMKVTDIHKPQSSCPFRSARQKIWGLGYSLLVFVYDKADDSTTQTGTMNIVHAIYIDKARTADYQTTTGIQRILENDGNKDDLIAFMEERFFPVDEIAAGQIADELLGNSLQTGYLTTTSALHWQMRYSYVIDKADTVSGIQWIC